MTWVRRSDKVLEKDHECPRPRLRRLFSYKPSAYPGDLWKCDRCGEVWEVYHGDSSRWLDSDEKVLGWKKHDPGKPPKGRGASSETQPKLRKVNSRQLSLF